MGRGKGKLKLQLMSNKKARIRYFEKRKKSVEKAGKDLSTLCGVQIGMLFYSPDLDGGFTWSSQPGALADLIASVLAAGPNIKTFNVSDFLKERMMESEEGRAMEEEGKLKRAMEEDYDKSDRAMVVEEFDRAIEEEGGNFDWAGLVAEIGEERREITESLSSSVVDQEMWTYEQLSAANFDCFSVLTTMMNFGGGGDLDSSTNGAGMCASADTFGTPLESSYDFGSELLDLDSVFSSEGQSDFGSEFDSCFSMGGQSLISPAANWFINEVYESMSSS